MKIYPPQKVNGTRRSGTARSGSGDARLDRWTGGSRPTGRIRRRDGDRRWRRRRGSSPALAMARSVAVAGAKAARQGRSGEARGGDLGAGGGAWTERWRTASWVVGEAQAAERRDSDRRRWARAARTANAGEEAGGGASNPRAAGTLGGGAARLGRGGPPRARAGRIAGGGRRATWRARRGWKRWRGDERTCPSGEDVSGGTEGVGSRVWGRKDPKISGETHIYR